MMEELNEKLDEYAELFGNSFPTFPFMHLSDSEMIELIDRCLNEEKDVYDIGILSIDESVKY